MSPLARFLLVVLRFGVRAAAVLLVLFMAIEIGKRWQAESLGALAGPDLAFLAILAGLIAGALWLSRAIGRELRNGGS